MTLETTTETVSKMAAAADALGSTLKFEFKGGEGVIFLDGSGAENVVSNEDKDADCTVAVDIADLNNMVSGELNPMNAFMTGKLKISGDMGVAMKLGNLFN
ncbi:MAG: SCP2 sterol-binding domain-containing protein [Bacteroidota bacterium]